MAKLEGHHIAWLSAHPERDAEWLRTRLRDGFHVHHLDGDHFNNDPSNLLLIDGIDHLRLHGIPAALTNSQLGKKGGAIGGRVRAQRLSKERRIEIARNAVAARWASKQNHRRRNKPRPPIALIPSSHIPQAD